MLWQTLASRLPDLLILLLDTETACISQSLLLLGVHTGKNSFQKHVARKDKMMYNTSRAAGNHLSRYAQPLSSLSAGCVSVQGELGWFLLKTTEHLPGCF